VSVMTLRHSSPVISPNSWIIVALKSMRFAGVVGNAFYFAKTLKNKSNMFNSGLRGGQNCPQL
jgi:hypothetical protein